MRLSKLPAGLMKVDLHNINKIYLYEFLVIIGVISGSLFALIYCEYGVRGACDFVDKIDRMNIKSGDLFNYISFQRLKLWCLCFMLSFTFLGGALPYCYSILTGFMSGFTCALFACSYQFKGVLIFAILCMLSHVFVYTGNIIIILGTRRALNKLNAGALQVLVKILPFLVISLLVLLFGSYLESKITLLSFGQFYQK